MTKAKFKIIIKIKDFLKRVYVNTSNREVFRVTMMKEKAWDKKLNIDTIGRDASKEDEYHYPYEPTPYSVLEKLVESNYISKDNIVIDYGCGKGRVGFFLNNRLGCKVIGIDFDEKMCDLARKNLLDYGKCRNMNI